MKPLPNAGTTGTTGTTPFESEPSAVPVPENQPVPTGTDWWTNLDLVPDSVPVVPVVKTVLVQPKSNGSKNVEPVAPVVPAKNKESLRIAQSIISEYTDAGFEAVPDQKEKKKPRSMTAEKWKGLMAQEKAGKHFATIGHLPDNILRRSSGYTALIQSEGTWLTWNHSDIGFSNAFWQQFSEETAKGWNILVVSWPLGNVVYNSELDLASEAEEANVNPNPEPEPPPRPVRVEPPPGSVELTSEIWQFMADLENAGGEITGIREISADTELGTPYAEAKADALDEVFRMHGTLGEPAQIKPETVADTMNRLARDLPQKEPRE